MPLRRWTALPLSLLLAFAASASAQDDPRRLAAPGVFSQELDQIVYKGVVGNVLDAIPMDPSDRLDLQRTNAVLSNTLFGRSLAVLAGLSNPVLLLGGFVWGIWAAANIKPAEAAGATLAADPALSGGGATQERMLALLAPASAADEAVAQGVAKAFLVSSIAAGNAELSAPSRPPVLRIWLPQRSPALPR